MLIDVADKYGIKCGEDLWQNDEINIALPEILNLMYSKEFGNDWSIEKDDK